MAGLKKSGVNSVLTHNGTIQSSVPREEAGLCTGTVHSALSQRTLRVILAKYVLCDHKSNISFRHCIILRN